jgi:hypothetical protein
MDLQQMMERYSDLSAVPDDPAKAEGYSKLHALWNDLSIRLGSGRGVSSKQFQDWERETASLLKGTELARFQKPLRPHVPLDADTTQYARLFNLMKILRARQGWERFMADTGF